MEEAKGVVKHVVLVKFKDGTSPEKIEELVKGLANVVNLIPSAKAFHWGTDLGIVNMPEGGFSHMFEVSFESPEGVSEYMVHPAHVEFGNLLMSVVEKISVFDYKPTFVCL